MRTALLALSLLASCAAPRMPRIPTQEDLQFADLGPAPTDVEPQIKAYARDTLKLGDVFLKITEAPNKGWYPQPRMGFEARFAWQVPVAINTKNSAGDPTGETWWNFFFLGENIVAVSAKAHFAELHGGGRTREQAGLVARK